MEYCLAHFLLNLETLMEIQETSGDLVIARFVVLYDISDINKSNLRLMDEYIIWDFNYN